MIDELRGDRGDGDANNQGLPRPTPPRLFVTMTELEQAYIEKVSAMDRLFQDQSMVEATESRDAELSRLREFKKSAHARVHESVTYLIVGSYLGFLGRICHQIVNTVSYLLTIHTCCAFLIN